jgi:hypothetical protein
MRVGQRVEALRLGGIEYHTGTVFEESSDPLYVPILFHDGCRELVTRGDVLVVYVFLLYPFTHPRSLLVLHAL